LRGGVAGIAALRAAGRRQAWSIAREAFDIMARQITRYAGGAEAAQSSTGDELDPRALLRAFWRRKVVFVGTVVMVTAAAVFYAMTATPLYTGETLVRIEPSQPMVIDLPEIGGSFEADASTIESEVEMLQSRAFAGRMVDELGLLEDAEFNKELEPDSGPFWEQIDWRAYVPAPILDFVFDRSVEERLELEAAAASDPDEAARLRAIQAFRDKLSVGQISRSYVLRIAFTSEAPDKAARIANAVGENYIVSQLEKKHATAERAADWLKERVDEMRERVVEAESKIVEFQNERGLSSEGRIDPLQQQLGEINTQLSEAQATRAEAEARYNQVQSLLRSADGVSAAAKVLNSEMMSELRSEESELRRELSELSTMYGERHPQMVNVRAELENVREKMVEEVERIVNDLSNEVEVARARERELRQNLERLQGEVRGQDVSSVELRQLEREADSAREIYENFLQRLREVNEAQNLQRADATILSAADVPVDPSWPNKKLIVLVAFGASVMLGSVFVFLLERWDSDYGFRSAEEVHAALDLKALALVPDLSRRETRDSTAEEYILHRPQSAFAEALQRIRTSIFLASGSRPPKTVLVTSSVPVEGKSLISVSLARQSARSGLRTLLIDADLRRPRLHEVVRVANQNGLADVLYGDLSLEAAIRTDDKSGLKFVPAGIAPVSPPDLFRSKAMRRLLDDLEHDYDLVIVDSPPVGAVSDSLILSGMVDRTLYVVRWERTPRNVATAGIRQVEDAGGEIAGVVLSRVDVRKHAQYGYADSGAYSGHYGKYYVN